MSKLKTNLTSRKKPTSTAKPVELEDVIYEMAISGAFAKAARKIIKDQLQAGIPVTYLKQNDIVREYPDGRIEVIGHIKKSTFKAPPGVEIIPSH
jgi:hypothetical protein